MAKLVIGNNKQIVTPALVKIAGSAVIDSLSVTPTTSAQTITASGGVDGYSPVNVAAVTSAIDANIQAGNIKDGVSILGVTGTYAGGVTPTGTINITSNGTYDVTNYASADVQVPSAAPTYYIDKTVDAYGNLQGTSTLISFNGVRDVGAYGLAYAYCKNTNITGAINFGNDLHSLAHEGSMIHAFSYTGATSFNSGKLTVLGSSSNETSSFAYAFQWCISLATAEFPELRKIDTPTALDYAPYGLAFAFSNCQGLTSISFPKLVRYSSPAKNIFQECFSGCTSLTDVYFGGLCLNDLTKSDFSASTPNMLIGLSNVTVHFPQEFQTLFADLGNMGGNNTVKLFDLPNNTSVDMNYVTKIDFSANKIYYGCTNITTADLHTITEVDVDTGSMSSMFANCTSLTNVDVSALTKLTNSSNMFAGCTALVSIDFPALTSGTFSNVFKGCTSLTHVGLPLWSTLTGGSSYMFSGCTSLVSFEFTSLQAVPSSLSFCFQNCSALTTVSFPSFTNSTGNSNSRWSNFLSGCSNVTVHFPMRMSSSMSSYNNVRNGFGGTNTTVLFDIVTSINNGDGVTLDRSQKDNTSSAIAWNLSGVLYYTSGLQEPQVGDTIYSDSACTTAASTIVSIM